ncbi:hypothetical protein EDD22DRAFT_1017902 [Suillus occidentalis]|nr:hypothetical protein EDD22DRAFT_1017902 [Suillus occidentalis]
MALSVNCSPVLPFTLGSLSFLTDFDGWEALKGGWSGGFTTSEGGKCSKDKEIMCFTTRPVETFKVFNDVEGLTNPVIPILVPTFSRKRTSFLQTNLGTHQVQHEHVRISFEMPVRMCLNMPGPPQPPFSHGVKVVLSG